MTTRPDSFEEFQRKQNAKRAAAPALDDNMPGLPSLSHDEYDAVESARTALATMRRTFEFWIVIARGLRVLKDKANRIGGKFTFDRLREREGLGGKRRDGTNVLEKGRVSRLLAILDKLPEVEAWRAGLTDRQRFEWASPEAVFRHCPVFQKSDDGTPPPFRPVALDAAIKSVLHHLDKIEDEDNKRAVIERIAGPRREDGDRFKPTDTAKDIARVLVGMFSKDKARSIAVEITALLKQRGGKPSDAD
jgi:hypothetical protein